MITKVAIAGYRSLRDVRLGLGPLNVVTGANGSGKSSLYRALRLLAEVAQGRVIQSLAAEGGFSSALWAGPETLTRAFKAGEGRLDSANRKNPVGLKLGFAGEDYGYAIDLGLPSPSLSLFGGDPQIKVESLWTGDRLARTNEVASRHGASVRMMRARGCRYTQHLPLSIP
jgi:predicted ATPase